MSQATRDHHSLLNFPFLYRLSQRVLGATGARKKYIRQYVRPQAGDKLLDIGCGTADVLNFLPPSTEYFGFDLNQNYINYAKKKFGNRGKFVCNDVNQPMEGLPKFDIVMANGILHHLQDHEVKLLFNSAAANLKQNGRLFTFDGCYTDKQGQFEKFLLRQDRGQYIRTLDGYKNMALHYFSDVKTYIRRDLLWFPYTIIILECSLK